VGIFWFLCLFFVACKGRLGPRTALDVEIAGLYWHFVDIVWIVIFTLVYLIGGFDTGPAPAAGVLTQPSVLASLV
jgi:heme/copper-type cytochrome/quinol oxidase subunit 3